MQAQWINLNHDKLQQICVSASVFLYCEKNWPYSSAEIVNLYEDILAIPVKRILKIWEP